LSFELSDHAALNKYFRKAVCFVRDISVNTAGNSEHDGNSSHYVSHLTHCLNLDVQVIQTVGRNATDLFVTSRELPENSGIDFNKGISL
jgi:hypothetical protein